MREVRGVYGDGGAYIKEERTVCIDAEGEGEGEGEDEEGYNDARALESVCPRAREPASLRA